MRTIPLTLNLGTEAVGEVRLSGVVPLPKDLHEYHIVPTTTPNDDGGFEVIEYSLVHRSLVAPVKVLEQREREAVESKR